MLRRFAFAAVLAATLTSSVGARTTPPETVDLVTISRIRAEGFARSQVMDTAAGADGRHRRAPHGLAGG